MRIIEVESYEKLSALAADIIGAQVLIKPDCVLGLATGSSPLGTYSNLVKRYEAGLLDFSRVRTVNLDEYCGLKGDDPQSYRYFMDTNLFNKVNVKKENTNLPDGSAGDMEAESERYEALVEALGWPDLQLLGIGQNGHIGFNEPEATFPTKVHTVKLTESTIKANSRLFDKPEDVPTHAITMGIGAIMKAKRVLLIAGADKAEIVERAFRGPVTPQVPASILQLHRDATVIFSRA